MSTFLVNILHVVRFNCSHCYDYPDSQKKKVILKLANWEILKLFFNSKLSQSTNSKISYQIFTRKLSALNILSPFFTPKAS